MHSQDVGEEELTDDGKLEGHKDAQEVEKDLENGPFTGAHKAPGPWRQDQSVPCCDSQCADQEVLVGGQVRGQIEAVGKTGQGHDGGRTKRQQIPCDSLYHHHINFPFGFRPSYVFSFLYFGFRYPVPVLVPGLFNEPRRPKLQSLPASRTLFFAF
jgi:hypothetical protein